MSVHFDPAAYRPVPAGANRSRADVEARIPPLFDGTAARRWADLAAGLAGPDPSAARLAEALAEHVRAGIPSTLPVARLLFRLRNEPFTIDDRPFWDPIFRTYLVPGQLVLKTARQVGKSQSLCVSQAASLVSLPNHQILHITPLSETTRRYSDNYMRPLLVESPFRGLIAPKGGAESVLQKDFHNGSRIIFSYALTDGNRLRGINASQFDADEVQDIYADVVAEAAQTLGASPWRLRRYTGTPKGSANTLASLWSASSQAEWCIWCPHPGCGKVNIPSADHDLYAMIGPPRSDICRERPGLVCAKCRKPISPRVGRWVHYSDGRKLDFPGYHIPQPLVPDICESPDLWQDVVNKSTGADGTTPAQFRNEVLGEVADTDLRLVGLADLRRTMVLPWRNVRAEAVAAAARYQHIALGVDWGGGGGTGPRGRGQTSFTALAVVGLGIGGKLDVLWGYRSRQTHDPQWEAGLVMAVYRAFGCHLLAHDLSNAGLVQEVLLRQSGLDDNRIVSVRYVPGGTRTYVRTHAPTHEHNRPWVGLAKTPSLGFLCQALKTNAVRFAKDNLDNEACVYRDFLALTDDRVSNKVGMDIAYIDRDPAKSDDFVHAVNFAGQMLWEWTKSRPNLHTLARFEYSAEQLSRIDGLDPAVFDWRDIA